MITIPSTDAGGTTESELTAKSSQSGGVGFIAHTILILISGMRKVNVESIARLWCCGKLHFDVFKSDRGKPDR